MSEDHVHEWKVKLASAGGQWLVLVCPCGADRNVPNSVPVERPEESNPDVSEDERLEEYRGWKSFCEVGRDQARRHGEFVATLVPTDGGPRTLVTFTRVDR